MSNGIPELTFDVYWFVTNPVAVQPFSFSGDGLQLTSPATGRDVNLNSENDLSFTLGIQLVGTNDPVLAASDSARTPLDGQLLADATFQLTVGDNAPVAVTVKASKTSGNTTPQQLADDFNTALQDAGITSVVAGLQSQSAEELIGSNPVPADGQLAGDAHFSLAVNNKPPVAVTVPERILAGTLPVPANGRLDANTRFQILVGDPGAGNYPYAVSMSKSSTSGNTSAQQLVNQMNSLLGDSGFPFKAVLYTTSGGSGTRTSLGFLPVAAGSISRLTLYTTSGDPMVTQFGFTNNQSATINTTPDELINDFNAALGAAGLAQIVASQSGSSTNTFVTSGDLTDKSEAIDHVASTINLAVGQTVTGNGIPSGTTVTGISGTTVTMSAKATVTVAGQSLVFAQTAPKLVLSPRVPGSVQVLTIHTTAADPTTTQLGYADGQTASYTSPSLDLEGSSAVPKSGQLAADASFSLTIDGGAPVAVTVKASSTSGNTTPQQLADDFNTALQAARIGAVVAQLVTSLTPAGDVQTVLAFDPAVVGSIGSLTLNAQAGNPMIAQLGFTDGQSAQITYPKITFSPKTPGSVDFLRLDAAATDPTVTELGFLSGVISRASSNSYFLENATVSGGVSLTGGVNDASGQFGFIGSQTSQGTVTMSAEVDVEFKGPAPGDLPGRITLSELQNGLTTVSTTGDVAAGTDTIQNVADMTGLVIGQGVSGTGIPRGAVVLGLSGTTVTLSADATGTAKGTALTFSNVNLIVNSDPIFGSARSDLTLTFPGFDTRAQSVPIGIAVPDINNPGSLVVNTSKMGPFAAFQNFTYADVLAGLNQTLTYLENYSAFKDSSGNPVLTTSLPMINKSMTDLVDYAGKFADFLGVMQGEPVNTAQSFVKTANEALARYATGPGIRFRIDTQSLTPTFAIDLAGTFLGADTPSRMDIENVPSLIALTTDGAPNLATTGVTSFVDTSSTPTGLLTPVTQPTAALSLTLGFDLGNSSDPKPFLYDGNDIVQLSALVQSNSLSFSVSFGKIGVYAGDPGQSLYGTAIINSDGKSGSTSPATASVTLAPNKDGTGRDYFAGGHLFTDSIATLTAGASTSLPILLAAGGKPSAAPLSFVIPSVTAVLDKTPGSVTITAPSLKQAYALFAMINKTPDVTSGVNKLFLDLQADLNQQLLSLSYPVVGTQLLDAGQFIEAFRPKVLNELLTAVKAGNPVESIQQALFDVFGPGEPGIPGLDLLVGPNGQKPATIDDVHFDLAPDDSSVKFSLNLRQDPTLVAGLGFEAGLPAVQMDFPLNPKDPSQNTIDTTLGWSYAMNFGVNLTDGFFVDLSNPNPSDVSKPNPPLTITVDATPVPGQALAGQLNYLGVQATPTTLLTGALPVPANGQLSADSRFSLTIDGNAPISVTVHKADTAANTAAEQLADDFNNALSNAGVTDVAAVVKSVLLAGGTTQLSLGFVPLVAANVTSITLGVKAADDPIITQLGFANGQQGSTTEFAGTFTVGVANAAGSNTLTYQDLLASDLQLKPHLQTTVSQIELNLNTKFNNQSTQFLPTISSNFELQWPFSTTDPDLTGAEPRVVFSQIGTNWAQTVANFLGPNFGKFLTFLCTGPVGDILNFLQQPIPVVSYLAVRRRTSLTWLVSSKPARTSRPPPMPSSRHTMESATSTLRCRAPSTRATTS